MTLRSFTPALAAALALVGGCIVATPAPTVVQTGGATGISWGQNLAGTSGGPGTQFIFFCPGGGSPATVWGTDIYSDDSSICTAAVHAGVIGFGGGTVRVVVQPGQASYAPSFRNGVQTSAWGTWGRSFSFF